MSEDHPTFHYRSRKVIWGMGEEHAALLRAGLFILGEDYLARVCPLCDGTTRYRSTITHNCMCDGTGLLQGSSPAPLSVLNQVLVAANPVVTMKKYMRLD